MKYSISDLILNQYSAVSVGFYSPWMKMIQNTLLIGFDVLWSFVFDLLKDNNVLSEILPLMFTT